jgi:hypothetical protein
MTSSRWRFLCLIRARGRVDSRLASLSGDGGGRATPVGGDKRMVPRCLLGLIVQEAEEGRRCALGFCHWRVVSAWGELTDVHPHTRKFTSNHGGHCNQLQASL